MRDDDPRTAFRRYWTELLMDGVTALFFTALAAGALYVAWGFFG